MTLDYRGGRLTPIRTIMTKYFVYPLQYTVDLPFRLSQFSREYFSDHNELSSANRELRALVGVYAARDQKYYSIARENQRLRSQLSATPAVREKFTLTEILSVSSNPFSKNVVINKGSNDGIFVGQVALAGNNIYGQAESVTPNSAVIMQLTDARHAIHVRNTRTGQGALAVGTGKVNRLELKHVETSMDIQTGDRFVSSGLGQLFPADFPVAEVDSVAYNPGDSFMRVSAKSLSDFNKTREILMIWRADYSASIEASNKKTTESNAQESSLQSSSQDSSQDKAKQ